MKTTHLNLRAAMVSLLMFLVFLGAWQLSATAPSVGAAAKAGSSAPTRHRFARAASPVRPKATARSDRGVRAIRSPAASPRPRASAALGRISAPNTSPIAMGAIRANIIAKPRPSRA